MSKSRFNEVMRATATIVLSAGVAAVYFGVMGQGGPVTTVPRPAMDSMQQDLPDQPAAGRRWRSSNAEQSLAVLSFFGEPNHWARYGAALESGTTLFQMPGTVSSADVAQRGIRVTVADDYLPAYLATPFLGAAAPEATQPDTNKPFVIGPVLARAFAAETARAAMTFSGPDAGPPNPASVRPQTFADSHNRGE
jgi:hypothetical protein